MINLLADKRVAVFLIFFSVWAVYLGSLDNEFQFDDFHSIKSNRSIRSLDNIPLFFTDPRTFSDLPWMTMYRPVLLLSYGINYYLTGPGVTGFNMGNILIHSVNAILIYFILILYYPRLVSLSGAMFFGLMPICTQAVNYKSSRSVLLVALFVLLAFRFYTLFLERGAKERTVLLKYLPYFLSLLFYALGLLSKEITIMFPVLLILYDLLFLRAKGSGSVFLFFADVSVMRRHLPFWIMSVIYLIIRKSFFGVATIHINMSVLTEAAVRRPRSVLSNMATQLISDFIYLRESLIPYGLSPVHELEDASGFSDWRVILLFLLFISLSAFFYRCRLKDPLLLFGFFWFFIALVPESVIPLNIKVNESRAYFPAVGLSLSVSALCNISFLKYRRLAESILVCYLIILAVVSINRNMVWNDGWSLWSDTVKKAPNSERVYYNLGSLSNNKKNYEEAIRFFKRSIELNPAFHRSYNLLGVVLFKLGRLEEAVENLKVAVKLAPYDGTTYFNLGIAYARQNEIERAAQLFEKSLKMKPDFFPALIGSGRIFEIQGDYKRAFSRYREALSLEPGSVEARARADGVREKF